MDHEGQILHHNTASYKISGVLSSNAARPLVVSSTEASCRHDLCFIIRASSSPMSKSVMLPIVSYNIRYQSC